MDRANGIYGVSCDRTTAQHLLLAQPSEPIKAVLEKFYLEWETEIEENLATVSKYLLDILWEIYVIVLTYRYHRDGVNRIIQQQQSNSRGPLQADALCYAAVELMMACRDNRTAALVVREIPEQGKNDKITRLWEIRSDFQLPMPPETGRNQKEWREAFLHELYALFDLPPEYLKTLPPDMHTSLPKKRLQDSMKKDGRTRFIVFVPGNDNDTARCQEIEDLAKLVKTDFLESERPIVEVVLFKRWSDTDVSQCVRREEELSFLREVLERRTRQKNT